MYIGIYWNNHHHLLHATRHVRGSVLWANLHLLFWLSLLPFATGWMGASGFAPDPQLLYGMVLLMSGIAYWILEWTIISGEGEDSLVRKAVGKDRKGIASVLLYAVAIPCGFFAHWVRTPSTSCSADLAGSGSADRKNAGLRVDRGEASRWRTRTES